MTLNSIAAAVLGGVGFLGGQGTMRGALAGSLLLSILINVMFFLGLPPVAQYVVQGLIIVGAVALPQSRARRADGAHDGAPPPGRRCARRARHPAILTSCVVAALWIVAGLLQPRLRRLRPSALHRRTRRRRSASSAAGQTLVVIGGGIDLSVGAVITVAPSILPLLSFDADPTGLARRRRDRCCSPALIGLVNGLGDRLSGRAAADHDAGHGDHPAGRCWC